MTERTSYIVTELAGPKVAGRRVAHGDTIELTEAEARAELIAGVIAPHPAESSAAGASIASGPGEAGHDEAARRGRRNERRRREGTFGPSHAFSGAGFSGASGGTRRSRGWES